jgi:hypothetical protein
MDQIVNPYARKRKVESSKATVDLVESQKEEASKNGPKMLSLSWNAAASKKAKAKGNQNNQNKNKTLQVSQPEPDYNLPMSVEYARALVKKKAFPYKPRSSLLACNSWRELLRFKFKRQKTVLAVWRIK